MLVAFQFLNSLLISFFSCIQYLQFSKFLLLADDHISIYILLACSILLLIGNFINMSFFELLLQAGFNLTSLPLIIEDPLTTVYKYHVICFCTDYDDSFTTPSLFEHNQVSCPPKPYSFPLYAFVL